MFLKETSGVDTKENTQEISEVNDKKGQSLAFKEEQ